MIKLSKEPEFINIYELIDPRDNLPRCIGYTKLSVEKRLGQHINENKRTYKCNWLKSLKEIGLKLISNVIDVVLEGQHKFFEKYWISQYRTWGFDSIYCNAGREINGIKLSYL